MPTSAADGLPDRERRQAMLTIVLGLTLVVLDATIVTLALPGLAADFQASAAQVVWVVNAYQVAILAVLLPLALLGDLIGYRRVYIAGITLFTGASLGCMVAPTLGLLVAARALQGLGAAGLMAVNTALVRRIYPPQLLGRGVALNSLVVAVASVAGPPLAALILSVATWPWLFAANLPLGAWVLWTGRRRLPRNAVPRSGHPSGTPPGLSWPDVLLNAAMFSLLFFGANALVVGLGAPAGAAAGGRGASSPQVAWALLAAGLLAGGVYLRRQQRLALPMLPLDLLRIPIFRLSLCTSVGAFAAHTLATIALPFLLLDGLGRSHAEAGLVLAAWPLATALAAPLAGRLIGRLPDGLIAGVGLGLMAAGLLALFLLPDRPAAGDIAWRVALCGAGFGLFQSPNNHTLVSTAPPHRAGGASGMLGTARLSGQSLAAVVVALLFGMAGSARGPHAALLAGAGAAAVGCVFSLLRLRHPVARRH